MAENLLFEIGTEELPSSCIAEGIKNLKTLMEERLKQNRLGFLSVETYATPRRITAFVNCLEEKQAIQEKIITGPPSAIAFDRNGNHTDAAVGFAKSLNVDAGKLEEFKTERGTYLGIRMIEHSKSTVEVLPDLLKNLILLMSFSKQMTWGDYTARFARPIRWIAAIYGDDVVRFKFESIESSNKTYSHRILGAKPVIIPSPLKNENSYFEFLNKKCRVILNPEKRKEMILNSLKNLEEKKWEKKFKVIIDENLLNEVVNLVEFPNVLEGEFPDEFLYIPKEILIKAIQHHQRYFAVVDSSGEPATRFIIVQNGIEDKTGEIVKGNIRVLKARLNDAGFFYKEDKREDFKIWLDRLKGVIFYSGLGSLYDKSLRLQKICNFIAESLEKKGVLKKSSAKESIKDRLNRAGILCKCDLVTNLVVEFPELQGLVGREYAREKKEKEEVAEAIFEHYLPRFAGDILPETDTGSILSIADKVDTIAGMFLVGNIPSGSEDPFALRRKASGIILAALKKSYDIDLLKICEFTAGLYIKTVNFKNIDSQRTVREMADFIIARYRFRLEKQNKRTDIFDAVIETGRYTVVDFDLRCKAVEQYLEKEKIERLSEPMVRCKNIIKGKNFSQVDENLLNEEAEIKLHNQAVLIRNRIKIYMNSGKYHDALLLLVEFGGFINEFFDKVLVMDRDEAVRQNRINLVKDCTDVYYIFADFSKISQI
ncbi:MAG: glycine--tRNA ligase subunit beta [Actinobacteria bacterium]|nr:glycine--tRNA ligase subunit beta [Actinomycetota bacterium]